MRMLEYTLPDGTTATAGPDEVAEAVTALLMNGAVVVDPKCFDQLLEDEARYTAIVRAIVRRAAERGVPGTRHESRRRRENVGAPKHGTCRRFLISARN